MKERPILFSAPMVRAIFEGRKTQTRRVVTWANSEVDGSSWSAARFGSLDLTDLKLAEDESYRGSCGCFKYALSSADDDPTIGHRVRSRWHVGDRLWVRESFQPLLADGMKWADADYTTGVGYAINYVATSPIVEFIDFPRDEYLSDRVTPSIFMPRWASRIALEVTEVRAQTVREISEPDAIAEGARVHENPDCEIGVGRYMYCYEPGEHSNWELNARLAFHKLWNSINAKRGFGWSANPWVWALTFERVSE